MKKNFYDVTIKDLLDCYLQAHPEIKPIYEEFLRDELIHPSYAIFNDLVYKMLREKFIFSHINYDYSKDDMPVLRELLMYAVDYMLNSREYVEIEYLESHDKKIAYFYSIAQYPLLDLSVDEILIRLAKKEG